MFGSDYLLGYSQGRSSSEDERDTKALVGRLFYGQRPVQVDQSYLDELHQLVEKLRSDSNFNYKQVYTFHGQALRWKGKAEQFHGEALHWRGRALPAEADAKALRAQLAERDTALAKAKAACAAERTVHQTTHEEKWGLNLFRLTIGRPRRLPRRSSCWPARHAGSAGGAPSAGCARAGPSGAAALACTRRHPVAAG